MLLIGDSRPEDRVQLCKRAIKRLEAWSLEPERESAIAQHTKGGGLVLLPEPESQPQRAKKK